MLRERRALRASAKVRIEEAVPPRPITRRRGSAA
jgi:hypothetical protein